MTVERLTASMNRVLAAPLKRRRLCSTAHSTAIRRAAIGLLTCAAIACGDEPRAPGPRLLPPLTASQPPVATVDQLQRLQLERAERWHRLQVQLEALQRRTRTSRESPVPAAGVHADAALAPADLPSAPVPGDPAPAPAPAETSHPLPAESAAAHSDATSPSPPSALPHTAEQPASTAPIVTGPIDRLALADSLFAVGDTIAGDAIYRQLDRSALTASQQAWVEYQLAGCDRHRGDDAAAVARYRVLVEQGRPDWLAALARWWLTHLEDRARLQSNTAQLTVLLQNLETEVNHELDASVGAGLETVAPDRR